MKFFFFFLSDTAKEDERLEVTFLFQQNVEIPVFAFNSADINLDLCFLCRKDNLQMVERSRALESRRTEDVGRRSRPR